MTTNRTPDYVARLREATIVLQQTEAKLKAVQRAKTEPIAIIGLGCRFPGDGARPETFWKALRAGVDAVREAAGERWSTDCLPEANPGIRWAGLLDAVDSFDAQFFSIAPREA